MVTGGCSHGREAERESRVSANGGQHAGVSHGGLFLPIWCSFFDKDPEPPRATHEHQHVARRAVEVMTSFCQARKYGCLSNRGVAVDCAGGSSSGMPARWTLEAGVARLTKASGNGRLERNGGTLVNIRGSTGGFTRAVLYEGAPPSLIRRAACDFGDVL